MLNSTLANVSTPQRRGWGVNPDLEQTLFWNRDSPIWIFFWHLPINERGVPVSEWGLYFFLSFESRTTRSQTKWGSPFQNGVASTPCSETGSPCSVMDKRRKKIPNRVVPFQKRVCSKLGINIYLSGNTQYIC